MNEDLVRQIDLATQYHQAARMDEARNLYRQILLADPFNPDVLHQYGVLAYQEGRLAEAVQLIERALAQDSNRASFHNSLGSAYLAAEEIPDAIAAFRRAINLKPSSFEMRNNLANALQAAGHCGEAIENYRIALNAAPHNPDIHNNLGRALSLIGEHATSIDHLRIALKARPNDPDVLTNLGESLCGTGEFEEAADVCRAAIAHNPDAAFAHNNLGNAMRGLGRLPEALEAYRRAIVLNPTTPAILKNLGTALFLHGDAAGGEEIFQSIIALGPDASVIEDLGHTYFALGRYERAVAIFRHFLSLQPGKADTLFALGLALNELGRHSEGLQAIAEGPGIVHLIIDDAREGSSGEAPVRIAQESAGSPDFIGRWSVKSPSISEKLIDLFENQSAQHQPGRTSAGLDVKLKRTTDLVIYPKDLETPTYVVVKEYLQLLRACCRDYAVQWPAFGEMTSAVDIVPFNIQRYDIGGHFQLPHCERFSIGSSHRVLAWMTYLNGVDGGGETLFQHYGLKIRPETGMTLIWPAEWTHRHSGAVVTAGKKYVITGWMHFPYPRHQHAVPRP